MTNKMVACSLLVLSLISCSAKKDSILGEYVTIENNRINRIFYNGLLGEKLLYGLNLKLNADSTYVYTNCAQINVGKWYVVNDTLKLKCEQLSFRIKECNNDPKYKNGTICSNVPKSLFIDGNTFEEKIKHKRLGTYSIVLKKK